MNSPDCYEHIFENEQVPSQQYVAFREVCIRCGETGMHWSHLILPRGN